MSIPLDSPFPPCAKHVLGHSPNIGPLQQEWKKCCVTFLEDKNQELALKDVVHIYLVARNHAFKVDTILSTWRKSGIHPINPQVFSDKDFTPSHAMSCLANVPSSYPTIMPSFGDNPSSDSSDNTFIPQEDSATSSDDNMDDFSNSSKPDKAITHDKGDDLHEGSCARLVDNNNGNNGNGNKDDGHDREHNRNCNREHDHDRDMDDSSGTGHSGDNGGSGGGDNHGGEDSGSSGGGEDSGIDSGRDGGDGDEDSRGRWPWWQQKGWRWWWQKG